MLKGLYNISTGNDAMKSPAAGVGIPSKCSNDLVSRLNLANLQAAAIGKNMAGISAKTSVSKPDGSAAHEIRKS